MYDSVSVMVGIVPSKKWAFSKIVDYDIAAALQGAIVKDEEKDKIAWKEYLENVMKKRGERYRTLYKECKELNR